MIWSREKIPNRLKQSNTIFVMNPAYMAYLNNFNSSCCISLNDIKLQGTEEPIF